MAVNHWLVDKSAYVRLGASRQAEEWVTRIDRGLVRVSNITLLELGFSARSGREARTELENPPLSMLPVEYLSPATEARALEVQLRLADEGLHRAPSIPDLLIAATAELAGLTVLHVDKDFELIAKITGQPTERLTGI
ncbi:PIN domain nuclease [Antribacter gilvus]|uniref:PIN domain nuclease n=1 Tax=Antribacter gilvus TaxID=2304675 RepID=UPI000F788A32|nr:PIN domain nuclease [Antribacter gilvus]